MEHQEQAIMSDQLPKHIFELKAKMAVMGYSKHVMDRSGRVWDALLDYSKTHEVAVFSPEYCDAFRKERYGEYYSDKHAIHRINKPLTLLLDFIRLGVVIRQKNNRNKAYSEPYRKLFEGFLLSQLERGLSASSIGTMRSRLHRLENFLLDLGIRKFDDVTRGIVNLYIESYVTYSTSTASSSLREFGRLCDYAVDAGFHTETFSNMIPHVRNIRRQRLPHTFTHEEIQKLLAVIDRSNPIGKRDYAMLLLTAKLGLRVGDVRMLIFSSLDWTKKTIAITQQKTGKFLELPLSDDVGWAIIDYLKNGRPACDNNTIFVSHVPPYDILNPVSGNLVAKYMRKAGIETPQNRVCGMHTLRHSLATGMLNEGIPLPTISSVLGHADISSTESYLRVDISGLRKCALEVDL